MVLAEVASTLQTETGWQDPDLLDWFWRTLAPAFETLDAPSLAAAREAARGMSAETALAYAASQED